MNNLLKIIEINNKLKLCFPFENIYELFFNDYCFEYYNILKRYFSDIKLVIDRKNNHVAFLIDNVIYDVRGIVDNPSCFEIADNIDLNFVKSFYKKFSDSEINKINMFIKTLHK